MGTRTNRLFKKCLSTHRCWRGRHAVQTEAQVPWRCIPGGWSRGHLLLPCAKCTFGAGKKQNMFSLPVRANIHPHHARFSRTDRKGGHSPWWCHSSKILSLWCQFPNKRSEAVSCYFQARAQVKKQGIIWVWLWTDFCLNFRFVVMRAGAQFSVNLWIRFHTHATNLFPSTMAPTPTHPVL